MIGRCHFADSSESLVKRIWIPDERNRSRARQDDLTARYSPSPPSNKDSRELSVTKMMLCDLRVWTKRTGQRWVGIAGREAMQELVNKEQEVSMPGDPASC